MPRHRQNPPLNVFLNNELVGALQKDTSGAIAFSYDEQWVSKPDAVPVSLSLPLRGEPFRGGPVQSVFENLLPDSDGLRRLVAERIGAAGTDAYSLLTKIGRDCVGALQFIPEGEEPTKADRIAGEIMNDASIERLLGNLGRAPLGLDSASDFRISVAGAQEKTALLWHNEKWLKPVGSTPTSHILKNQVGKLPNGMDLSNSVENEFYCMKLMDAFGLPVAPVQIRKFGARTALVVTRFDRKWITSRKLIRLAQEDCCAALSIPPTLKYQNQGGPGMFEILDLLKGADVPYEDQLAFVKAQILFWLIAATDGHAKNFSIFLGPHGRFRLTPLYDVLSAEPSVRRRQIETKQVKLAMFVGDSRHYRIDEIEGRHFVQTVKRARLPESIADNGRSTIADSAKPALAAVEKILPKNFPAEIHESISKGILRRLKRI
jgi:serine/threonine-protein kinase HipA